MCSLCVVCGVVWVLRGSFCEPVVGAASSIGCASVCPPPPAPPPTHTHTAPAPPAGSPLRRVCLYVPGVNLYLPLRSVEHALLLKLVNEEHLQSNHLLRLLLLRHVHVAIAPLADGLAHLEVGECPAHRGERDLGMWGSTVCVCECVLEKGTPSATRKRWKQQEHERSRQ